MASLESIRSALASQQPPRSPSGAAILLGLVEEANEVSVLFEQRSFSIDAQPGEVSLPGGHIEAGETFEQAAIREACEELLVDPNQIEVFSELGDFGSSASWPIRVFVGTISNYRATFDPAEVDHTFCVPLAWLIEHPPTVWHIPMTLAIPDDFPFDLIPGGRAYPWGRHAHDVPFYLGTDPIIWGLTARIVARFCELLEA